MSRILPPFILAACTLGGGWWLGSRPAESALAGNASGTGASPAASVSEPLISGLARRSALLLKLENSSAADIQRLLNSGRANSADAFELARRWAEQDPAGMWNWLLSGGWKKLRHADVTTIVFEVWFLADPDAAIAAFRNAPEELRSSAASGMLSLLLTADSKVQEKLIPLLEELTADGDGLPQSLGKEAEDASRLLALPDSKGRDALLMVTARSWMDRDWKGATAWAANLTEPLKLKVISTLVDTALNRNFRRVFYPGQKEGSFKDDACFAWAREWFTTSAPAELRHRLGPQFVEALAQKDAGAALAWAQENLSARPLAKAVTKVLEWTSDPQSARAIVDQLPPGGVKQRVAFAAARNYNAESIQWLMGQAGLDARDWSTVGSQWALSDPEAFRKFVTPENQADLPKGMLHSGINNLVRKDPAGTLTWATTLNSADLAGAAVREWSRNDAPAAAAWFKSHPDTPLKPASVSALAEDYFRRSAGEAVEWATTLPSGAARDAAIAALRKQLPSLPPLKPDQRPVLDEKLGKP